MEVLYDIMKVHRRLVSKKGGVFVSGCTDEGGNESVSSTNRAGPVLSYKPLGSACDWLLAL